MGKIDTNKMLQIFKKDIKTSKDAKSQISSKIARNINEYNGKKYGNERKGKSELVQKDIKKHVEWLVPNIMSPFLETSKLVDAQPSNPMGEQAAKLNENILNYQFTKKFNRYNFFQKLIKVLAIEGVVFIRTGWEREEVTRTEEMSGVTGEQIKKMQMMGRGKIRVEVIKEQFPGIFLAKVHKKRVVENKPTAIVCKNEDIYIDPTCEDDIDKATFVGYKYETSYSSLVQQGGYKNLDKLREHLEREYRDDELGQQRDEDATGYGKDHTSGTSNFEDIARRKITVYEYWGDYDVSGEGKEVKPIVAMWCNDVLIKFKKNPYPDGKKPFISAPYSYVPYELYGDGIGELLSDNQKVRTAIMRGFIDNMAMSNNGQKWIKKNSLDEVNKERAIRGEAFVEFNGDKNDIIDGSYNQLPTSIMNISEQIQQESEALSGVSRTQMGLQSSETGQSATAANIQSSTAQKRMALMVQNIAENIMKPLFRKWISYNKMFLEPDDTIRINGQFVPFKRDDLNGDFDFDIILKNRALDQGKVQQITMLIQQGANLGAVIPGFAIQNLFSELLELWDMPALAQAVKQHQPQPDPIAQAKAQADVMETQAKAQRLGADAEFTQQKAAKTAIENQGATIDVNRKFVGVDQDFEKEKIILNGQANALASIASDSVSPKNKQ